MHIREVILGILLLLPLIAAQYFNISGDVLTLASVFISGCLWVAFIRMIPTIIANRYLRIITELVLTTALAVYFFGQLLSYYLQGSYFNARFFFHVDVSTISETWRAYLPLLIIFIGWIASIWLTVWTNRNRERVIKSSALVLSILVFAIVFDPGLRTSSVYAAQSILQRDDENLNSINWEELRLNKRALQSDTTPALAGKNLVMVFLEGFDKLYTDEAVFPGLTPNILALNNQGWQLENLRQRLGTDWTMAGLVSSLCGTPLLHDEVFTGNQIMFTKFLNRAVCLPDILHEAGYQQSFMGGASLVFAGKGIFLNQHSFDHVYGLDELKGKLPDPTYRGGWGLFDDSLFELALQEFDKYSQKDAPFNLTLLTIDTHHPAGKASRSCPKYSNIDNSILHAVHCTDYLVGNFIRQLQSKPAFANTLVVLLSDHLAMRNDAYALFPKGYDRRLYFNVLNSDLLGSSDVLASPMDLAPTILNLLGVTHNTAFLAGSDLLSKAERSKLNQVKDAQRNRTIAFLNSKYLTSVEDSGHQTALLAPRDFEFLNQIEHIEVIDSKVMFKVTGKDPYFILPKFENLSGDAMTMIIDMDAPAETDLTVFYLTGLQQEYSLERSRVERIKAGNSRIFFPLPADADFGRIRVDPGSIEGDYTIHSIEIRM